MTEIALHRIEGERHSGGASLPVFVGTVLTASLFIAFCAHLSIPLFFTPVPLSLAPFAVILLGLVLPPRLALTSAFLYLCEGAAGLPVFSPQGPAGFVHLVGPTGGYLLSYPFAAALASVLYRLKRPRVSWGIVAGGAASLLILVSGASWLKLLTHMNINLILGQAVIPFVPGDILKVCAAAWIAIAVKKFRSGRGGKGPFSVGNMHDADSFNRSSSTKE